MAITANASMSAEEKNRLLQGPALDPPANVTPNFDNPGGNHGVGYGIVILGAVLATIAVLMRIVTRWAIKKVYISDFLLFSAYVRVPPLILSSRPPPPPPPPDWHAN